ncbi:MAG: shikimate kinase [Flavobacteriales bacterium]|nr:shikimate kinase [Flavobacteriales bacterium]
MDKDKKIISTNIILVGYAGSGKSHWGKKLAKFFSKEHVDLDFAIEKAHGKSIQEIFDSHGEEEFRRVEAEVLRSLDLNDLVLSVGGGTPAFHENMNLLLNKGFVVYLELSLNSILHRLKNKRNNRPRIKSLSEDELSTKIQSDLKERVPYYERAHLTVKSEDLKLQNLANAILEKH